MTPDPQAITLELPEPPALNAMLNMAKKRARGGLPIVYSQNKASYEMRAAAEARKQAQRPRPMWKQWRLVSAHFRLWNERDPLELLAGLKWPIDMLVNDGWVEDDGPAHLVGIPLPTQEIDRKNRGITLVISEVPG